MSQQSIKQTIDLNVYQNGQQRITGNVMNSVLNAMVDDEYSELVRIESKIGEIDIVNNTLTYQGKKYLLIEIEEEEPTYSGAICGRAICGQAICGTE